MRNNRIFVRAARAHLAPPGTPGALTRRGDGGPSGTSPFSCIALSCASPNDDARDYFTDVFCPPHASKYSPWFTPLAPRRGLQRERGYTERVVALTLAGLLADDEGETFGE